MLHWPSSTFTVLVITIVTSSSSTNSDTPSSLLCPPNWIYITISDKCIKSSITFGSHDKNQQFCKNLNASMITIGSAEENDEIHRRLEELRINRFWISGKTEGLLINNKIHRTIVHTMTDYTNWGHGSPSCSIDEKCCIIVDSHKFWVDMDCSEDLYFTCEKRAILESSYENSVISMENPSSTELICHETLILNTIVPKKTTQFDDIASKIASEIEANRAMSELVSESASLNPLNSSTVSSFNQTQIPVPSSLASSTSSVHEPALDPGSNESNIASLSPNPPVVTVSEELINHIIKRYQKDQLNVIRLWFDLIRTHRNSSERSGQLHQSITKSTGEGFQLSNYLLVILTVLSITVLVATIITLSIITRRFIRQKTQDTYQLSSRLLELGYNAYD